jgi:AmmeMemoRadiSam system protein B
MKELPQRPALRLGVDVKPVTHEGEQVFVFRDALRLAPEPRVLSPLNAAIAQFFDGTRTLDDVAALLEKHGLPIGAAEVGRVAAVLDEGLLLEGERFEAALATWSKAPIRKPAFAGGSYPAEAGELARFLDAHYTRAGGPGAAPDGGSRAAPLRALLSPHIDFHRGGHAYAWGWKALAEACEAELFVVFGTAHQGTRRARFALTKKSYETPLGTVETDGEIVERLAASYAGPDDLFEGEVAHMGEHSIEFQMVELAHLFQGKRKIRAVPVLCGGLHDLLRPTRAPSEDVRVKTFHDALAKALDGVKKERVCFVGGVDLAHVGTDFDDEPLTEKALASVLEQDRTTLGIVTGERDADAFHRDVARDQDARRICGHSAIAATLEALARHGSRVKGELLCHDRWYDGASSVTFASAGFRATGKRP